MRRKMVLSTRWRWKPQILPTQLLQVLGVILNLLLILHILLCPKDSNPETSVVLQTAEIKAHVEVFLVEVDKDLELDDLPPLENVTPIPIQALTIPRFIPFTMSTSQHCIPSKGLPQAYHPYEGSVGWCSCEAGGWCNDLPCSSRRQQFPQKV